MSDLDTCHIQPGQIVECIDDEWFDEHGLPPSFPLPVSGCIYTVSGLKDYRGGIYLQLEQFGANIWCLWAHFRPVPMPDISPLRELLLPSPDLTREAELA